MSSKRANGEGTIFKRIRNGSTKWYAELVTGYDAEGKKKVIRASGDTRKEVAEQLAKWQNDRSGGVLIEPSKLTVAQFLDTWMDQVVAHNCKATTQNTYQWIVRRHLKAVLGATPLGKLTPAQVQGLYHQRLKEGLNALTVRSIHMVLHRALDHAVRQGLIPLNVADRVERPKIKRQEMRALTPDEGHRLLEATKEDRLHALFVIALTMGLRLGELLGLRWQDIDWEAGTLTISQTISDINGKMVFNTPKTTSSCRTLDAPPIVFTALRKWKKKYNEDMMEIRQAWAHPELVFTSTIGTPIGGNNLRKRSFVAVMTRAGLVDTAGKPVCRFHDLRHTAISMMGYMGLTAREAQEMAGHSNISTTLGIYSHVFKEQKKAAAQKLESFWADGKITAR